MIISGVTKGFGYGKISVVKLYILADKSYVNRIRTGFYPVYHSRPLGHVRIRGVDAQLSADNG